MKSDDTIAELIESLPWIGDVTLEDIERAIMRALEAEREACAKIAENYTPDKHSRTSFVGDDIAENK